MKSQHWGEVDWIWTLIFILLVLAMIYWSYLVFVKNN